MKKLTSIISAVLFFFSHSISSGEPLISELRLGEKAPFEGVLLSKDALGQIEKENELKLLDKDFELREFKIEKQEEISKLKLNYDTQISKLEIDLGAEQKDKTGRLAIKDERIKNLTEDLKNAKGSNEEWYFVGGFVAAALIVGFSVWVYTKLDNDPIILKP